MNNLDLLTNLGNDKKKGHGGLVTIHPKVNKKKKHWCGGVLILKSYTYGKKKYYCPKCKKEIIS